MQSERSIGIFILVCSLFCLIIAVDKYYSAIVTADEFAAEALPGFQLESVGIPTVTLVCGTIGVMLLVASVILITKSFRAAKPEG